MPSTPRKKPTAPKPIVTPVQTKPPLVFISHDSRDAALAEAFADLLRDTSGGMLKSFRSSDRKGTSGIEFGQEWYNAVMTKLDHATDVVALLTEHSLERPWILYETGVGRGKLNSTVLGLALGVSLEKASTGPFAQFQNCGEDEDSITKLVLQLIQRIPNAAPDNGFVRTQVARFLQRISTLKPSSSLTTASPADPTPDLGKLFEEIKIMINSLGVRMDRLSVLRRPQMLQPASRFSIITFDSPQENADLFQRTLHGLSGLQSISQLRRRASQWQVRVSGPVAETQIKEMAAACEVTLISIELMPRVSRDNL